MFENAGGGNLYGLKISGYYRFGIFVNGTETMSMPWTGNVGIGTTAPTSKIQVNGKIATIGFSIGDHVAMWADASNGYVDVGDANTLRMRINSGTGAGPNTATYNDIMTLLWTGNVGIGTTGPGSKLDVYNGSTDTIMNIGGSVGSAGAGLSHVFFYNSASTTPNSVLAGVSAQTSSSKDSGQLLLRVNNGSGLNTAVMIKDTGNVGIGSSSPAAKLDVAGDIKTSGAVIYGTLNDFRLAYRDDFESVATGWSMTTRSACGNANILGGYNVTAGTSFYRDYDLTGIAHTEVMVRFTLYLMDTWDGETVYSQVGGIGVFSRTHSNNLTGTTEICGLAGSTEMVLPVEGRISHSTNTLRVLVGSTLNEAANNESFGIDNVEVWVR